MKSSDVCIKTIYNRGPVMNEKELESLLEEAMKTDKNLAYFFNGKMTVSRNPAEKRIKADTPLYDDLADARYIESLSDCKRGFMVSALQNGIVYWWILIKRCDFLWQKSCAGQ